MSEARPLNKLRERLFYLDAALTRKPDAVCFHTAYNQLATAESVVTYQYHLSDSGWSRVGVDPETGRIFLTSNSRSEVKDGWKFCKELISDVEVAIREELEAMR